MQVAGLRYVAKGCMAGPTSRGSLLEDVNIFCVFTQD